VSDSGNVIFTGLPLYSNAEESFLDVDGIVLTNWHGCMILRNVCTHPSVGARWESVGVRVWFTG
jgi:hypothetical protein